MTYSLQKNKAFTLVELLVSIGLFSIIMTLAAGAYLLMVGISDRAHAVALASDNVAFVLENMSRSILTGTTYRCGGLASCTSGTSFSFVDADNKAVIFTFIPPAGGASGYVRQTYDGAEFRLTDPSINITELTFVLSGGNEGDDFQPFVRIWIEGEADMGKGQTFEFKIQTAAAMRGIDV